MVQAKNAFLGEQEFKISRSIIFSFKRSVKQFHLRVEIIQNKIKRKKIIPPAPPPPPSVAGPISMPWPLLLTPPQPHNLPIEIDHVIKQYFNLERTVLVVQLTIYKISKLKNHMKSVRTILIKIPISSTMVPSLHDSGKSWIKALADWVFLKNYDFAWFINALCLLTSHQILLHRNNNPVMMTPSSGSNHLLISPSGI